MPQKSNWKRRRLAPRVKKVVDRHKDTIASVRAFEMTLVPASIEYVTSHDRLRTLEAIRGAEVAEGELATATLYRKTIAWKGQIAADGSVPGFDPTAYGARPTVADDVIADTESLIDVAVKAKQARPESLPFVDLMLEDLTPALESARKESLEAEAARSEYQILVEQNRHNAARFDALIISFRQTLAAELGRAHPGYQYLRASKIERDEEEDEDAIDVSGEPEVPNDDEAESQVRDDVSLAQTT